MNMSIDNNKKPIRLPIRLGGKFGVPEMENEEFVPIS